MILIVSAEAVALAHKLFDKMHCQELLQKDMSAGHVSMRSPRGGIWTKLIRHTKFMDLKSHFKS